MSKALKVYDPEQDQFIEVTPDQAQLARNLHQQISYGIFVTAIALKRMRDEKLYLAFSCETFNEYLESFSPISRGQAFKYLKIASRFQKMLPEGNGEKSHGETFQEYEGLGMRKLYELSRLEEADFEEIKEDGKLTIDGKALTIEDIRDMTARELENQISKMREDRKKYQSKISQLDEENKTLASEKKLAEQKLAEAQKQIEENAELEKKYGPRASKLDEKRDLLTKARRALEDLEQYTTQCNIDAEDPTQLQQSLIDLIKDIDIAAGNARRNYDEVIANLNL